MLVDSKRWVGKGGSGKAQRWMQEEAAVAIITRSVVHGTGGTSDCLGHSTT